MEYEKLNISDLKQKLENEEQAKELFLNAKKNAEEFNIFKTIVEEFNMEDNKTLLTGIPYILDDNISTKEILTTASSEMLKDYIPVYDATVYRKLKEAGAVLLGKTSIDELGIGSNGSLGSATAVAEGIVPFAIGSDTGGFFRTTAASKGVVGFKPTYGKVSRYGLFPVASSLDTISWFTRSVKDSAIIMNFLKGNDKYDMTSLKDDGIDYTKSLNDDIRSKRLFYFKELYTEDFKNIINQFQELGFVIEEVSFFSKLLKAVSFTYKIISSAEATSNNANLTGILFGTRGKGKNIEEIIFNARTKGLSEETKKTLVLGSYVLQEENQEKTFLNAQRIRRLIVDKINSLFEYYDGFIIPVTDQNNYLAIANFGGYPSITIPINSKSLAINIMGPILKDSEVLNMAYKIEEYFAKGSDLNV